MCIYQGEIVLKHATGGNATTIYMLLTERRNNFLVNARAMFSPVTHWKQEKRGFYSMCYNRHNNREYIQSTYSSDRREERRDSRKKLARLFPRSFYTLAGNASFLAFQSLTRKNIFLAYFPAIISARNKYLFMPHAMWLPSHVGWKIVLWGIEKYPCGPEMPVCRLETVDVIARIIPYDGEESTP